MNKVKLRKHMAEILKNLTIADKKAQSEAVFSRIIHHPKYKQSKRLSIFLSTDNEVNTKPIIQHALEVEGKRCFIPLVRRKHLTDANDTRMIMVELESMEDLDKLPLNHYGIKEPKEESSRIVADPLKVSKSLDLIIVPGVAFARDGRRLGHGKGYYDEYLMKWSEKLKSKRACYTIGISFRDQIVEDPGAIDGSDYTLDEVITG